MSREIVELMEVTAMAKSEVAGMVEIAVRAVADEDSMDQDISFEVPLEDAAGFQIGQRVEMVIRPAAASAPAPQRPPRRVRHGLGGAVDPPPGRASDGFTGAVRTGPWLL